VFCGTHYSPEIPKVPPRPAQHFAMMDSVMTSDAPVRCDKSRPGPARLRQEPSAGTKSGLRQGPGPPGSEQLKIMDRGQDHRTAFEPANASRLLRWRFYQIVVCSLVVGDWPGNIAHLAPSGRPFSSFHCHSGW
jgi:hypothetical protein